MKSPMRCQRLGRGIDEVFEPYLEIVLRKEPARLLSSADHPLPVDRRDGYASVRRTRRQPALPFKRQGTVASIPDDVHDKRVRYGAPDLAKVEHMRGCGLDPSLHSLCVGDGVHETREEIRRCLATADRLADDGLDVETRHASEISGQECLDEASTHAVRAEMRKPARHGEEVRLLAVESETACRDEHRIQQRGPDRGQPTTNTGRFIT